jgi:hypothetical protein
LVRGGRGAIHLSVYCALKIKKKKQLIPLSQSTRAVIYKEGRTF